MKILVTGGAGFIGSALVRYLIQNTEHEVLNLDKLTYAGSLDSLDGIKDSPRYQFSQTCICDEAGVAKVIADFQPHAIIHLAAESHVDRSIDAPRAFIETNINGTFNLLHQALHYWQQLSAERQASFRFHHVSTDEVYGDLPIDNSALFTETTPYAPSSPYAASKAAADHLVRAWHRTYGLPTLISNCANNYGPFQNPEKLIPKTITNALSGKPIPIYGDGSQIRDWLQVDDHAKALLTVLEQGTSGETYNIGSHHEKKNHEVVRSICDLLETHASHQKPKGIQNYQDLITFVTDRPGHDTRYAIDARKIQNELQWQPQESLTSGLEKTVLWYLQQGS